MNLQKAVALRISNLLIEHNMSRYALCKKVAMPEQTLKHIIDERNKNIELATIATIIAGFDMSLEEFFSDELFAKNSYEVD